MRGRSLHPNRISAVPNIDRAATQMSPTSRMCLIRRSAFRGAGRVRFPYEPARSRPRLRCGWGARHYRPTTATFTSRDTYNGRLDTPISLNRYTYAHNNPLQQWDPDGHRPTPEYGGLGEFTSNLDRMLDQDTMNQALWYHTIAANNGQLAGWDTWWAAYYDNVITPNHKTKRDNAIASWVSRHSTTTLNLLPTTPFDTALKTAGFQPLVFRPGGTDDGRNGHGVLLTAVSGDLASATHILVYVPGTGAKGSRSCTPRYRGRARSGVSECNHRRGCVFVWFGSRRSSFRLQRGQPLRWRG